ncbi:hypothetical protein Pyn_41148 [Prunus yedoensis var. nudiflora]|uniref:Uncharacterized protein n=1 Tax=Prunus yedoensis var. nudiflora TaxID=2094558 RepID=A0A314V0H0_PRUYE|nr:hypothetical protein Pyn_41148 [Prunus yedoensis var. nudiflora]
MRLGTAGGARAELSWAASENASDWMKLGTAGTVGFLRPGLVRRWLGFYSNWVEVTAGMLLEGTAGLGGARYAAGCFGLELQMEQLEMPKGCAVGSLSWMRCGRKFLAAGFLAAEEFLAEKS